MVDQFRFARSGAFDNRMISRVIADALSELKKSIPPGSKKPRTEKGLSHFLDQVNAVLAPLNIPVPAVTIDTLSEPPKGPAWAVKVGMMGYDLAMSGREHELADCDREFIALTKKHSQRDVYLAAIALSSPEHDHGEIRQIREVLDNWKKSSVSEHRSNIAGLPRSPFVALVLKLLDDNRNDSVASIWLKLCGCDGMEFRFKDEDVSLSIKPEGESYLPNKKGKPPDPGSRAAGGYVVWYSLNEASKKPKGEEFLRTSFDGLVCKLRGKHGIRKDP